MSCVPGSITSIDAMVEAVRRCGVEYGGPDWAGKAMMGAATLVIFLLAVFTLWVTLQALRR